MCFRQLMGMVRLFQLVMVPLSLRRQVMVLLFLRQATVHLRQSMRRAHQLVHLHLPPTVLLHPNNTWNRMLQTHTGRRRLLLIPHILLRRRILLPTPTTPTTQPTPPPTHIRLSRQVRISSLRSSKFLPSPRRLSLQFLLRSTHHTSTQVPVTAMMVDGTMLPEHIPGLAMRPRRSIPLLPLE